MNKAVFLDRDGVINEDTGYVHKIEDLKIIPKVIDGLKLLKDFKLIIITNQSGIGRGYYTEKDFHNFNDKAIEELRKDGIIIEETYYCPHHPDRNCDCRKPNIKYIKEAQKKYNIDLERSFVIGDHSHDIELGKNAGCKTIFMMTGHGKEEMQKLKVNPEFIAKNLLEAAKWIVKQE